MPLSLTLAAISTAAFVAAAAVASPEWPKRKEILSALKVKGEIAQPQGRALVALAVFSVVSGIPAALGFLPVAILVPFGGLVFLSFVGSRLSEGAHRVDPRWLAVMGIALISIGLRFETIDLPSLHAAQGVLGPSFLVEPFLSALLSGAAVLAGLVSALFLVARAPSLSHQVIGGIEPVLRWVETALAVSMIACAGAGPSISVLVPGPLDLRLGGLVLASTLFGLAATAGVSLLRRKVDVIPERPALIFCSVVVIAALLLQPLAV